MKFFAFLFSFYILLLSIVPCCAPGNCQDDAQLTQQADNRQPNNDCQNCSPFNQCGNCVGFTLMATFFAVDSPLHLLQPAFPLPVQFSFAQYISSFWQPPKSGSDTYVLTTYLQA